MILILILDIGRKMILILILILPFSRLILILDETDHNSEQTYQRLLMFVYIIIEKNSVRQVQKQSFIPNEKTCGTKLLGLNFDFDFQNQLILILSLDIWRKKIFILISDLGRKMILILILPFPN